MGRRGETDTVTEPAPEAAPGNMIETGATPGGWRLGFWILGFWKLGLGRRGENCGIDGGGTMAGAAMGRKEGADGGWAVTAGEEAAEIGEGLGIGTGIGLSEE